MRAAASKVLIYAACLISAPALAQISDSRKEFIEERSCVLAGKLRATYEASSSIPERDRYVVLSNPGKLSPYVQCSFIDERRKLHCEASSSYYAQLGNQPRQTYPSAGEKKSLEVLGFDTANGVKNFIYEKELKGAPNFDDIARLMLHAMHDGFGTRAETQMITHAPIVGTLIVACRR